MTVSPIPWPVTNAHELSRARFGLWVLFRLLVPRQHRQLYEGHLRLAGQMWFEDRCVLYNTVLRLKPRNCFEIGTWLGGGSTLVVARALRENGFGKLHTIEVDSQAAERAVAAYDRSLRELRPFVEFHCGDYREVFLDLIERAGGVDFFVLDGAEDGVQTFEQFRFFDRFSHSRTGLFAHDWESEKSRLLRPELERSDKWWVDHVVGLPKSVGLAVASRRR